MSSITVGKYVMWTQQHTSDGKTYKKGSISKIIDIDRADDMAYFTPMEGAKLLDIFFNGSLYDTNIEALEASEDLLNPKPVEKSDDASIPSWHVAAIEAGMISKDSQYGTTMPPPRPSSWVTSATASAPDYSSHVDEEVSTATTSARYPEESCVYFKLKGEDYEYTVKDCYLAYEDGDDETILYDLGYTSNSSQASFCKSAYGYEPVINDEYEFPEYKYDDYQAAERVIDAIKIKCRAQNAVWEREKIEAECKEAAEELAQAEAMHRAIRDSDPKRVVWSSPRSVGKRHYLSGVDPYKKVEEKFEYTPVYKLGTYVEFDTGRVSYSYKVQSHYMTCSSGWDAIYKELGVNPESFIKEATGKNAVYHNGPYGIVGHDMVSSDKLINALLKACADNKGTVKFVDTKSDDHVSPLANPVPSYEDVLETLKVDQLEVN